MKINFALFLCLLIIQQLRGQATQSFDLDLLLGKKEITASTKEFTLLPQVALAFEKMEVAAKKDSVDLKVVSSYRSYNTQKSIWNRKYKRFISEGLTGSEAIKKIVEYSTLPGTSRHHWGTDVDLIEENKKVEGDVLLEEHFSSRSLSKTSSVVTKKCDPFWL